MLEFLDVEAFVISAIAAYGIVTLGAWWLYHCSLTALTEKTAVVGRLTHLIDEVPDEHWVALYRANSAISYQRHLWAHALFQDAMKLYPPELRP